MDSLDDIWNDRADNATTEYFTPSSRKKNPLFLEDSGDEGPPRPPQQRPPPEVDIDIDAMFEDVENADDPFNFKPLAPSIDTEALRREAEARHKKGISSSIPTVSATTGREAGHGSQATSGKANKMEEGKKERKQPMRLDEARLLGPSGFPKLIKETKDFRIKGKGYEIDDLNRLLQIYSYWTHEMYPKTTLRDTVERVEKLCHSKRMHVALSVWRDEVRGSPNGHKPDDEIIDIDEEDVAINKRSSRPSSPTSDWAGYAQHPTVTTELGDEDDFDIDAIILEEERRTREQAVSQALNAFAPTLNDGKGKGKESASEEDVAMWEALDAFRDDPSSNTRIPEDEYIRSSTKSAIQGTVEDEEMWDIIRQLEGDSNTVQIPNPAPELAITTVTTSVGQEQDDDWDSVYV